MIVVGAGPVGLTLAMDLAWRGADVIVLERRERAEPPSVKCNHISARSMEIFRRLGVADRLRAAGLPQDFPHDAAYRTSVLGHELSRTVLPSPAGRAGGEEGADTWWPTPEPPHRINQRYAEPIMTEHAVAMPGLTLLSRCEVTEVRQDGDSASALYTRLEDGETLELSARFLVGCDGPRSLVRGAIGASFEGPPMTGRVQSTLIRAPELLERDPRPAWTHGTWNPRRSGAVFAIDGREQWLIHSALAPHEEYETLDRDHVIRTILGVDDDFSYEVLSVEDYQGRALVADRFRDRRMLIAGDAAHLWLPFAGYGMNAGIADAADLAWQLAAHLHGWAPEALLDAYAAERQPVTGQVAGQAMSVFAEVIKMTQSIPPEIEEDSEAGERARAEFGAWAERVNTPQYACGGLNFGTFYDASPAIAYDGEDPPPYTLSDFTPSTVPGCRVPHLWLEDGRSLYDALGPWFTLVRSDRRVDATPLLSAADRGVPLELLDVDGDEATELYDHALVLARPDQHVAWRGRQAPEDPAALIDLVRGA